MLARRLWEIKQREIDYFIHQLNQWCSWHFMNVLRKRRPLRQALAKASINKGAIDADIWKSSIWASFRIWEDCWTPEVSGFGERRGDWLLSFLRGRAWWKEQLQRNFLSWRLTKNLVNTFASIPRSSYVAKDTFLARGKFQLKAFNTCRSMQSLSTKEARAVNLRVPLPSQIIWSRCRVCDRLLGETKFAVTHSKYQSAPSQIRTHHICPFPNLPFLVS